MPSSIISCVNAAYADYVSYSQFSTDGDCYVYGNVMSLVNATAFPVVKTITAPHAFEHLFYNCGRIYSYESNKIVLPATTLANGCYMEMFGKCNHLTTAPELPATTLAGSCYMLMFQDCSSLTTAPELPATTLAGQCYMQMFCGCSNLSYVKCLVTDIPDNDCTLGWLSDVSDTGTFIINKSLDPNNPTPWTRDVHGIPSGWTVQCASEE